MNKNIGSLFTIVFPLTMAALLVSSLGHFLIGCILAGFAIGLFVSYSLGAKENDDEIQIDSIIGNLIDTVIVIDTAGVIRKVNKAALDLLAYREDEVIGQPMGKLLEDEEFFQMLRGLIEAGSVREFELTYVTKHGRKVPMSSTGSLIHNRKGIVERIVCIAKDVTEQKQAQEALRESEERFRTLFENVPIGVYRTTPEGRIINANPAMVRMLGFETLEELMERDLQRELYVLGFTRSEFRQRIEREGELKGFEANWKRKDGSTIFVRENAKVVRDRNGAPVYYEGTVEDITERKKIEQMKNEFISIVSHELRVPLTSIRGALEWMSQNLMDEMPERARKLLAIAGRSSERMVRLVNDMLDIDKIESGKMAFYVKPLEIAPLVEHAIEANQPYADQMGVKLVVEQTLPEARVKADGDRLMQVMTNLLSNAAKFSPRSDQVQVSILRHNSTIRVAVTDHGPGIPEKFRSRIFQKFAQVQTSDPRQKGTGLGLSISKAIMEKMGGRIDFEINTGTGTTFYFELPEHRE